MVTKLRELKMAIDFYIEKHGEDYPVKPIDIFTSIGYSRPKNGCVVIKEIEEAAQGGD